MSRVKLPSFFVALLCQVPVVAGVQSCAVWSMDNVTITKYHIHSHSETKAFYMVRIALDGNSLF